MKLHYALFWVNSYFCMREQWKESGILAQANGSRLSESIKNPPRCLHELSLRRRALVLSEKASRSGEEVSPKREKHESPTVPLLEFSPRRKELA